jgi:hypothetical protein
MSLLYGLRMHIGKPPVGKSRTARRTSFDEAGATVKEAADEQADGSSRP